METDEREGDPDRLVNRRGWRVLGQVRVNEQLMEVADKLEVLGLESHDFAAEFDTFARCVLAWRHLPPIGWKLETATRTRRRTHASSVPDALAQDLA